MRVKNTRQLNAFETVNCFINIIVIIMCSKTNIACYLHLNVFNFLFAFLLWFFCCCSFEVWRLLWRKWKWRENYLKMITAKNRNTPFFLALNLRTIRKRCNYSSSSSGTFDIYSTGKYTFRNGFRNRSPRNKFIWNCVCERRFLILSRPTILNLVNWRLFQKRFDSESVQDLP